ncbi:MAG TPA: uridine phosphorylase [bacterium]|nr:uridine phosphorylase [bacterium]
MLMTNIYHINLNKQMIKNAKAALIPGDPARVIKIAKALSDKSYELAFNREYRTWIVPINKSDNILVTSTGIGGPSATIAIEELAYLGIKVFVRVGTTGSIQKNLRVGDIAITNASVRLDGSSTHYAPIEYPAVSDFNVTRILAESAESSKISYKIGITASSDTFYPGQERYDSYTGYVVKRFQGTMKEWQKLNVLNYEMESSSVLTSCAAMGLKAGCLAGVIVNRASSEKINHDDVVRAENNTIKIVEKSLEKLILLAKQK